jgi:NAD(P)-dependent dehydrogenase (short-subunit alcohol dehydrogenase family)
MMQEAGRRWIERAERGSIINMVIPVQRGPGVGIPHTMASRAGQIAASRTLAVEWAPHGIRVNAVAPGYLRTDMAPVDRPEFRRHWIEDCPQQRFALPEEIAPSVVFLASDAASFVTGSILVADGGYTAV